MAQRHRRVAERIFQAQHVHQRTADDVAAADDDDVRAIGRVAGALEDVQDAVRRAGQERRHAEHHLADADRMETIHILAIIDSFDYFLFGNMLR